MHCLNGNNPIPRFCFRTLAGGLLLLVLGAATAESDDAVEVISADSNVYDGWHVLDASIRFALDDELFVALEHGVHLNIDVLVEIRRQRKWLWDPVISSHRLGFILQHHPLTGAYVVTEPIANTRREFPDAREALQSLGTIRNYHLLNAGLLTQGEAYDGYIIMQAGLPEVDEFLTKHLL